ncbi:MAG: RNA 3'-terminal phosphate cyclase, partial [Planctomycetota bacterium]
TITEVFTGFGQRGTSAETVAKRAASDAMAYLNVGVPVWRHLADQLMLPLALAGGGGFRTGPLTDHATTNANVIESFLGVRVHTSAQEDATTQVRVYA